MPKAIDTVAEGVAAIVLAAGNSRRMGGVNKLLADVGGEPMVVRTLRNVLASRARPVVVVTGFEAEDVAQALDAASLAAAVTPAHNPDYAAGLSTSLRCGLAALPADTDGALVCLADMPNVGPAVLDRLIAAFDPADARTITIPTWQGRRGNPVLLAAPLFPELQQLTGDAGARSLIAATPEAVREVPVDAVPAGAGIHEDVDTRDALESLPQGPAPTPSEG